MPNREDSPPATGGDGKTWVEWKQEVFDAIEELDRACANARQVIYRLRPLVRPKNREADNKGHQEDRQPGDTPARKGGYRGRPRE